MNDAQSSQATKQIWRARTDWQTLKRRSAFFAQVRSYFAERDCLEVHVPILQAGANLDRGIELIQTDQAQYLISSPEHYLKRLLCSNNDPQDCYSISPCFRKGESGSRHNPEFQMLEWYRLDWDLEQLIAEVADLIQSCLRTRCNSCDELPALPLVSISYREAFLQTCQLDPFHACVAELQAALHNDDFNQRDLLLDLCMLEIIEPSFDPTAITILRDYPADQAAQARTTQDSYGNLIAQRFEAYHGGFELANGYWECNDALDIRQRMQHENPHAYRLDEDYLNALTHGLPACAGVALGLDRLFMLQQGISDIRDCLAFPQT